MYLNQMKIQFVLSQSNACLVIEKRKKRTVVVLFFGFTFWLVFFAVLSALINIHAHVYKTSNCVANSCFGKFSLQIAFKFKAPCGRKWIKGLPMLATCSNVTLHAIKFQITFNLLQSASQVLCMCSDILHPYEFLSCPKNINVSQIGVRNSLSMQHQAQAPPPYKSAIQAPFVTIGGE